MFQTLLLTKAVFHALRGAQPLFHALFGVKTLSTLLGPAFNNGVTGLGHSGFSCGVCMPMFTRNAYPDPCSACSSAALGLFSYKIRVFFAYFYKILVFFAKGGPSASRGRSSSGAAGSLARSRRAR